MYLFFCCQAPSHTGGATPLCDCRKVYNKLPQGLRSRLEAVGIMYRRAFGFGLGFSWSRTFGVDSIAAMNPYCLRNNMRSRWITEDRLVITYRRWAALNHPVTQERVWFNHGAFFNFLSLTEEQRSVVLQVAGIEGAPYHTFFGDGAPIELYDLTLLRRAYESEIHTFTWNEGDLLIVDNMLTAHGREPYSGVRRVLVTMTEKVDSEEIAAPETQTLPDPDFEPDFHRLRAICSQSYREC